MEPRISSLLVDPRMLDRNLYDPFSTTSTASSRPLPVEPSHVGDEIQIHQGKTLVVGGSRNSYAHATASRGSNLVLGNLQPLRPRPSLASSSNEDGPRDKHEGSLSKSTAKSSIPLAGVLNSEPSPDVPATFSGSLQDLLLEVPRKRRRIDSPLDRPEQMGTAGTGSGNAGPANLLTLPKPLPSKKGPRRQRIPPLLQGLHQPPPDAGLFPRITDRPEEPEKVANAPNEKDRPPQDTQAVAPASNDLEQNNKTTPGDETQSKPNGNAAPPHEKAKAKAKRHKWSEQETKDLLQGVARFGIGKWAKILKCSNYKFNGRTAVDLKDRFRTCCPDEYKKFKSTGQRSNPATESKSTQQCDSPAHDNAEPPPDEIDATLLFKRNKKVRSDSQRKTASDLAEIGIREPFKRVDRRARRGFSKEEDEALLKGYEKHGPRAWNLILKDEALNLSGRTPTDLRDRFRNRYPEKYQEAGYKLKPKPAATSRTTAQPSEIELLSEQTIAKENRLALSRSGSESALPTLASSNSKASNTGNPEPKIQEPALKPLITSFPAMSLPPFEDMMGSDEEYSPVVLNRNIIQWAGVNMSASSAASVAQGSTSHDLGPSITMTTPLGPSSGPASTNNPSGVDGLHVNPQAMILNPPSQNAGSNALTLPVLWKKRGNNQNLPVLPTLTLPMNHSSGTVGNGKATYLPPPADLLSGIDLEGSREGHSSGLWDDLTLPPL